MPNTQGPFDMDENTLQNLDPDLYSRIKPHIDEIVKELNKQELSAGTLDAVIDELITSLEQSGNIPFEDGAAIPVVGNLSPRQPFRPSPYRTPDRRKWRSPGGLSTDDLIRLLLLRELGYFWL